MAFTTAQLIELRTWLPWDPPTDADLQARADELGSDSIYPVVVEQLRVQYTILLQNPAQFTIPGDWSQNTTVNLQHLRDLMADATKASNDEALAAGGGLVVQRLVRANPYRLRTL